MEPQRTVTFINSNFSLYVDKLRAEYKSLVLHTMWCYISGEAAGEIWYVTTVACARMLLFWFGNVVVRVFSQNNVHVFRLFCVASEGLESRCLPLAQILFVRTSQWRRRMRDGWIYPVLAKNARIHWICFRSSFPFSQEAIRVAEELLGETCFVGWPHMVEALVQSVSDDTYK